MSDKTHPALALFSTDPIDQTFQRARGLAIQSYTNVEHSLVRLFAHLMGVPEDLAGVPFFRINNARARNAILARLLKKRHGNNYNLFRNSLIDHHLPALANERNHIVHWTEIGNVALELTGAVKSFTLAPPNYLDHDENTPQLDLNGLYDFILKCDFFHRLINLFTWTLEGRPQALPSSHQIFQEAITYPPPDGHLVSLGR